MLGSRLITDTGCCTKKATRAADVGSATWVYIATPGPIWDLCVEHTIWKPMKPHPPMSTAGPKPDREDMEPIA